MTTDVDFAKRLAELEKESSKIQSRFSRLEQDNLQKDQTIADLNRLLAMQTTSAGDDEVRILKAQLVELTSEKIALRQTIDTLQADRIKPTPTQLLGSFRNAMNELRQGLAPAPGDRVAYTVSQFDVDLKAQVSVDKKDETIRFILPEPGQELIADTLSQIRFTFQTVPRPEADDEEPFVVVPTLLQLSQETAQLALRQAGLGLGKQTYAPSQALPGTVIGQNPDPGDEIPTSETVDIIIAKSTSITMPTVTGLDLKDAIAVLKSLELAPGNISKQSSKVKAGTVLEQSIPVGTEVEPGTPVDLVVAMAETVGVPNIVGLKLANAKKVLKKARLSLGEQKFKTSDANKDGVILSQTPKPETQASGGTAVSVVIGRADKKPVPDVKKRNLTQATALLKESGFKVGKVSKKISRGVAGLVLSQAPTAHQVEPLGSAVDLVLSTKAERVRRNNQ